MWTQNAAHVGGHRGPLVESLEQSSRPFPGLLPRPRLTIWPGKSVDGTVLEVWLPVTGLGTLLSWVSW